MALLAIPLPALLPTKDFSKTKLAILYTSELSTYSPLASIVVLACLANSLEIAPTITSLALAVAKPSKLEPPAILETTAPKPPCKATL